MKYLWFALFGFLSMSAMAQENYSAALISKDLLPYASAVIRRMESVTEVKDLSNTAIYYKEVVTILNKNGDDRADIQVFHNKRYHIKYIKGSVYDESGKLISHFSEKNFQDYSAASDASLFEDSRVKFFRPAVIAYPYTLVYEYELQTNQSLNLPDWRPNPAEGTAVEYSSFIFKSSPGFKIRYKELNFPGKVLASENAQQKIYKWEIRNLKAIRNEPYSPEPDKYLTSVKLAPETFSYEGYKGTFTDWNSLGQWTYNNLLKTRGQLPAATVALMHNMTDSITNPKRKAKVIYEFMQNKNRYVSIQVGIGGLQPFLAADVDRLSYGDCKALVNYTQALLNAVNIESYYCIVQSGSLKKSLMTDFASMDQGDHVILCLPFKNDTTWLECTSNKAPFGFLGNFTDDRWVLACTPSGGKLLHTPKYKAVDNKQTRTANFIVNDAGELSGSMQTTCTGTQFEYYEKDTDGSYKDELKKLKENLSINNIVIEKLELHEQKLAIPVSKQLVHLKAADYATLNNGKYFFLINPANRMGAAPRELRSRTTEVYINRGYTDTDEITYTIPTGYKLDNIPLNITLVKPFGKFTAYVQLKGNQLVYKRTMQLIDGSYSKDSYQELVEFYQKVVDADNFNVALVKI